MIAALRGLLDSVGEDSAVIDVGGVGYLVFCSARTLAALPVVGEPVALTVETHVREDHIHLYGFASAGERSWFRLLTTVQGVGARVALAILSVLSPAELARAIAASDAAALSRASGVGRKLAQRIIGELRDRTGDVLAVAAVTAPAADGGGENGHMRLVTDAVSALVNLGYGRSEAYGAIVESARELGPGARLEAVIRGGLARLGAAA